MKKLKIMSVLVALVFCFSALSSSFAQVIDSFDTTKKSTEGSSSGYTDVKASQKDAEERKSYKKLYARNKEWISDLVNSSYLSKADKQELNNLKKQLDGINVDKDAMLIVSLNVNEISNKLFFYQDKIDTLKNDYAQTSKDINNILEGNKVSNSSDEKIKINMTAAEKKYLKKLLSELDKNKTNPDKVTKISNQVKAYIKAKDVVKKINKKLKSKNLSKNEKKYLQKLKKQLDKNKWNKAKVNEIADNYNTLNKANKLLKKYKKNKSLSVRLEKMKASFMKGSKDARAEIKVCAAFGKTGLYFMDAVYNSKYNQYNKGKHYVTKTDISKQLLAQKLFASQMKEYGDNYTDEINKGSNFFEIGIGTTYYKGKTDMFMMVSNGLRDIAQKKGAKF